MKIYEKTIDGTIVRKTLNQIVIDKDGMCVYNPSEELVLADGWTEYLVPSETEPTEEELFETAKKEKLQTIESYDTSEYVNVLYVNGYPMWLDKATRVGLKLRFEAERSAGKESTTLWYGGIQFPLPLDSAFELLYSIEAYASACYDNTQQHLKNVNDMVIGEYTIDDIQSYDYTAGYPTQLSLNL